jgi:hypothetical protein
MSEQPTLSLADRIKQILPGSKTEDELKHEANQRLLDARRFTARAKINLDGAATDLRLARDVNHFDQLTLASGLVPPHISPQDMMEFSNGQLARCRKVFDFWSEEVTKCEAELHEAERNWKQVFGAIELPR